jgi:lipopolysaccharide transport system permease protein
VLGSRQPVLASLTQLFRYTPLIRSLVARELRARYRGSVLGFFWSFANPLLQLLIFNFVFTSLVPEFRAGDQGPYALFLFCGLLPWTWFNASLVEAANVLIAGGNLIRKVLFPAEILPIVTVVAALVHFGFGLIILAVFLVLYQVPISPLNLVWFPVIVFAQLAFTLGLALFLSAITVHFRDVRDLLANLLLVLFWATPIVYALDQVPERVRPVLALNPLAHLVRAYRDVLIADQPFEQGARLLVIAAASVLVLFAGYFVFDRLRDTLAEEV